MKNPRIVELLRSRGAVGVENAITTAALKIAMSARKNREVTRAVEEARDNGAIICACMTGEGGYYLPATAEEAKSYIKTQRSRLAHGLRRYRAALNQLNNTHDVDHQSDMVKV